MNTKSLLTRIGVPVLSLGLLGGLGATLATSASASTFGPTVVASTHAASLPDTTVGSTGTGAYGAHGTMTTDPDALGLRPGLGHRRPQGDLPGDPARQPPVRGRPDGQRHLCGLCPAEHQLA